MPLPPVDSIVNVYETTFPFRSETTRWVVDWRGWLIAALVRRASAESPWLSYGSPAATGLVAACSVRSEEHTSELQSHSDLVCRLLLEKKKNQLHEPASGRLTASMQLEV